MDSRESRHLLSLPSGVNGFFFRKVGEVYSRSLLKLLSATLAVTLIVGCSGKGADTPVGSVQKAASNSFKINSLSKIVTTPGEVLTLAGSGFRSTLSLAQISGQNFNDANGQSVAAQISVQSSDKATLTLPAAMTFGKYSLTLAQEGESQQITLFSNGGKTDYPIFTAAGDEICSGKKFYDETGNLREGTKVCNLPLPDCSEDGAKACTATAAYSAAATYGLADKVLSGRTVAGVAGNVTLPDPTKVAAKNGLFGVAGSSLAPTLADCASDGGINCVAVASYPAAKLVNFSDGDIRAGVTVAGVAGVLSGAPANCASDGATGCITVPAYKAADMAQVGAGNIKSGVTIAGVVGGYPSVTYPLPNAGATADLPSLAASTAAGSYEWWGSDGTRHTGIISDAATVTPTGINQTFSTSVYREFTVSGDANLTAANIKNGVSLFSVTGSYPSSTYPLAGADSTADLDIATFDAKIKNDQNFEWFRSDGTRYVNAGDPDITATNIANGVTIFGLTGTLQNPGTIDPWNVRSGVTIGSVTGKLPVNCRNQGSSAVYSMGTPQTVTSINTTNSQLTVPSHGYTSNQTVRVNYSAVPTGLLYSTTYYVIFLDANTIQLSTASGPGSPVTVTGAGTNVTIYAYATGTLNTISSIDDYFNYTSSAYTYSNLWTSTNTCAGVEATTGDSNVWKDVTTDASSNASTCSGTPANCSYQDKISGLSWSKSTSSKDWANALHYCSSLTYNNQTGWRLPTQKELMNAYEHGIMTASNANWLTSLQMQSYFWSSSTNAAGNNSAWIVTPAYGGTVSANKFSPYYVSCVR